MALGKQIGILLLVTGVTSVVVYLVASALPKTYESELQLLFPGSQPAVASISSILGGSPNSGADISSYAYNGINTPVVGSSPQTASGILESRKCRSFVVDKLGLDSLWKMSKSKAAEELKRKANTKIDDHGFLIVTADAEKPEVARDIVKTMYEFLNSGSVELTLSLGKRNKKVLEERLKASEATVAKTRDRLVAVATNHPYFEPGAMQDLLSDAFKKQGDTRVALSAAEARIQSVEATVKKAIQSGADVATLQASSGGAMDKGLETLIQDLQKRRLELEDAKKTFTEKSPEFKDALSKSKAGENAVRSSQNESAKSLQNKTYAPLIQARSELESLRKSESGYENILTTYKKLALKSPEDASLVKLAQAQFDTAVKTSESLRFQLEQATIAEERDPARFEIVDEPIAATDPIAPRKGLITGAWAISILALGTWTILRKRITFVD